MIKIENANVYGIMDALRGMRNPLNSWNKQDSFCKCDEKDGHVTELHIGPNDERLCKALVFGGQPHRKFLRQINVTMDITAPVYWWAEMDTYKIGTTRNSCSVQHKGASRDFTSDDFTIDADDSSAKLSDEERMLAKENLDTIIRMMNDWRKRFIDSNKENYDYFRVMRQLMPMGYGYKTTWSGTYETLLNIYEWRHNHKLREWCVFCDEIEKLPGMDIFLKKTLDKPLST